MGSAVMRETPLEGLWACHPAVFSINRRKARRTRSHPYAGQSVVGIAVLHLTPEGGRTDLALKQVPAAVDEDPLGVAPSALHREALPSSSPE